MRKLWTCEGFSDLMDFQGYCKASLKKGLMQANLLVIASSRDVDRPFQGQTARNIETFFFFPSAFFLGIDELAWIKNF